MPDAPLFFLHQKVPCVGRGAAPDPAAVNQFFWIVHCFLAVPANARKFVLVHCTHGFNRTGFMICRYVPYIIIIVIVGN